MTFVSYTASSGITDTMYIVYAVCFEKARNIRYTYYFSAVYP